MAAQLQQPRRRTSTSGDRAASVMTPDDEYSHMLLGMTRSLGDFQHQRYGVTWEPEVVCKDLTAAIGVTRLVGGIHPVGESLVRHTQLSHA